VTAGPAALPARHAAAYGRLCAAEDTAPDARGRLAAAVGYLREVLTAAPAGVLAATERNVRASVMDAVAAVVMLAELATCAHPAAAPCSDPECRAAGWLTVAGSGRVVAARHRHCPDCQGIKRGGRWSL
jgi:hypothetical protein